jgi:hypothetical protein
MVTKNCSGEIKVGPWSRCTNYSTLAGIGATGRSPRIVDSLGVVDAVGMLWGCCGDAVGVEYLGLLTPGVWWTVCKLSI